MIETSSHKNARRLPTSRKHMTIRNEARDRRFDWNDCVKTCNMSKCIEYEKLKILHVFRKNTRPFHKTPLNWKPNILSGPTRFGLEGFHCTCIYKSKHAVPGLYALLLWHTQISTDFLTCYIWEVILRITKWLSKQLIDICLEILVLCYRRHVWP